MSRLVPLRDIAKVIRSKNAGPFRLTLDVIFSSREDFEVVEFLRLRHAYDGG